MVQINNFSAVKKTKYFCLNTDKARNEEIGNDTFVDLEVAESQTCPFKLSAVCQLMMSVATFEFQKEAPKS
jgi:hypothetical protein